MNLAGSKSASVATAAALLLVMVSFSPAMPRATAQEGASIKGYGRTKVGALVDNGDYFLLENTLDLRIGYAASAAAVYANAVLYERDGLVQAPDLREAYIDVWGDAFSLRVGKQQIIWGKADGVFITDLVSPKDLSRFLVPDFEELRLAVTGVKLDLFSGYHGLELVWLPSFIPTIRPDMDSIWAPALPFPVQPTITVSLPEMNIESGEYFAKYSYLGEAFDLSVMGGYFWNDTPTFSVVTPSPLDVEAEYRRTAAAGYAISGILGPVVMRSEGAYYFAKPFQANPMSYTDGYAAKDAIQYLVGVDYSIAGINFGLQFIQDIIFDYETGLIMDEEITNTVTVIVAGNFLRETLKAEILSYIGLDNPDALLKPKLTWVVSDGLEVFAGAYIFLGNDGDFGQYDDNDAVYTGLKLSF